MSERTHMTIARIGFTISFFAVWSDTNASFWFLALGYAHLLMGWDLRAEGAL